MRSKEAKPQLANEALTAPYLERILQYLQGTALDPSVTIPLDRSLLEAGILDSFGIVDLITFVEGEFNLEIPDGEITKENMGSLRKMANYVAMKKQKKAA